MGSIFENNKVGISRTVFVILIILAVFFFAKTINELSPSRTMDDNMSSTISVSGFGEVFAKPDVANFSFNVSEEKATVKEAQEVVTERMNKILEFLNGSNVEDKDIKTTNYNIYPRYEYRQIQCFAWPCDDGKRVLVGYEVSHGINVKIRDIEKVGELISGIGEIGASNVSGVSFSVDEEDSLKEEARNLAIEGAKEKAEKLADELDVDLVRVISFNESGYYPGPRYDMVMESAMIGKGGGVETPQIPTGENTITSTVNITYEIR